MNIDVCEDFKLQFSRFILDILYEVIVDKLKNEKNEPKLFILKKFLESYKDKLKYDTTLIVQEIKISSRDKCVYTIFRNTMVIEFKFEENKIDENIEYGKIEYLDYMLKAKYYVITNWRIWKIYRFSSVKLWLMFEGDSDSVKNVLKNMIIEEIRNFKIPLRSKLIEILYTVDFNEIEEKMMKVFYTVLKNDKVRFLFETYTKIMNILYEEIANKKQGEEFFEKLYVRHTLIHMIVMSSLTTSLDIWGKFDDVCSGVLLLNNYNLDVVIPYLNWWKIIYNDLPQDTRKIIDDIVENIATKSQLIDWDIAGEEDVLGHIYEILIELEARRRIGEYYTPTWLIDRILQEFVLRNKLVMDPFCGSGKFLVRVFYKKIRENENPEQAYEEIIGFDINPLATVVAIAELIIIFKKITLKIPQTLPHIYNVDVLAAWYGGEMYILEDPEYLDVIKSLKNYLSIKIVEAHEKLQDIEPDKILKILSKFRQILTINIKNNSNVEKNFENYLKSYFLNVFNNNNIIEEIFRGIANENQFISKLVNLVKKYRNTIWTSVITSTVAAIFINIIKPHIIVTNPPWIPFTEYKTAYVKKMRKEGQDLLKSIGINAKKAASIITGSDISCIILYRALKTVEEGVGFVMYREQSFWSGSSVRAGVITTYAVLKNTCSDCEIKLIEVDHDVFGHGLCPSLVIAIKPRVKK